MGAVGDTHISGPSGWDRAWEVGCDLRARRRRGRVRAEAFPPSRAACLTALPVRRPVRDGAPHCGLRPRAGGGPRVGGVTRSGGAGAHGLRPGHAQEEAKNGLAGGRARRRPAWKSGPTSHVAPARSFPKRKCDEEGRNLRAWEVAPYLVAPHLPCSEVDRRDGRTHARARRPAPGRGEIRP